MLVTYLAMVTGPLPYQLMLDSCRAKHPNNREGGRIGAPGNDKFALEYVLLTGDNDATALQGA